jgi:phosphatidate cytidylyltransferase
MAQPALNPAGGDLTARVASAAVLAPLALAVAYIGVPMFEAAIALIAGVLAWEWTALCGSRRPTILRALLAATAIAAVLVVAMGAPWLAAGIIAAGAGLAFVGEGSAEEGRRAWMALGAVYIAVPLAACESLRLAPHGRELVIWLLLVVWASDTVAYALGRALGGPKLAPAISPKKTWSGLAGAVIGAAVVGGVGAHTLGLGEPAAMTGVAGLFGLAGQGGDLMESAVKRRFGVKDTSRLIPGHGGLFDRLDALLVVVVLAAVFRAVGWPGGESW